MPTVRRATGLSLCLVLLVFVHEHAATTETSPPGGSRTLTSEPQNRTSPSEFIGEHCLACHNEALLTGGLTLQDIDTDDVAANTDIWEKVLFKLGTGQMPPMGMPRPDPASTRAIVSWLETSLDRAAEANPDPGRVGVHRLNQTEYTNAIRDLLALEVNGKSLLLPDEADSGFDNVAASLTMSPAHLERYMSAARKISRLAVGDPTIGAVPAFEVHQVSGLLVQDNRVSEDLPFGSRGGMAIRHHFPLDGEYVIRVRLRRQIYDYIVGMGSAQKLDIRVDGKRVARFIVGGEAPGVAGPLTWVGEIVGETAWELYMHDADDGLEIRVPVEAGTRTVAVSFVDSPREPEGFPQPVMEERDFGRIFDEQYDGYAAVDTVAIGGPYLAEGPGDTPSRRRVFVCRPASVEDEAPCARTILSTLAGRAYRRPATDREIGTLMDFYEIGQRQGDFEAGIQSAIERLLVSFNFLFRIEADPADLAPGTVYRLSDVDLASRLSFFLWSSIPDEELLDRAAAGELHDPEVLENQVRRMLADPRSRNLVDNFSGQWLNVRKANTWQPDPDGFPFFEENLRQAMLEETELFIDSQLRGDRSVVEMLSADYSFVNERLAKHYGLPGIYGERFRRVKFDDGRRGGLLGQGSILMVTSYPDRTTPVMRGLWLLDNMLGMPPPPPPANVPDLGGSTEDGRTLSIREQMARHAENPSCAICHVRMDPLGFALENFDAVGRYRTEADGIPIDASTVFTDGTTIDGIEGVRGFLLAHREDFVKSLTGRLLTFALGRRVEYSDHPAIRKILREAADTDYRWSSIILGIVNSTPFQMRRTAS